jgi:hypothetical protein
VRTLSHVFFLDPSPVRRVPIPTGIQRKLNFVSVRTIKGLIITESVLLFQKSRGNTFPKSLVSVWSDRSSAKTGDDLYYMLYI